MASRGKQILSLLRSLPREIGQVEDSRITDDPRTIVIYKDDPSDASVRFAIAASLMRLHREGAVPLVGVEGSSGQIDTSLISSFPIASVAQQTAAHLVRELKISGAEFAQAVLGSGLQCWGIENPDLYRRALEHFQRGDHAAVNALGADRAKALVDRLFALMLEFHQLDAAMTVCGNLPPLVCREITARKVSYVLVRPHSRGSSDWSRYEAVIGKR